MTNEFLKNDIDPIETKEWLDALDSVLSIEGAERANFLIQQLIYKAQSDGVEVDNLTSTPYKNTIRVENEKSIPNDEGVSKRIAALIRWNAVAMVLRA